MIQRERLPYSTKYYDLKFRFHAAAFFSQSEGGHREMKGTLKQQLRLCQLEWNQMYLTGIDGRSFCSEALRVVTNLKTKLMWGQLSPNYLRFWIAKSVTVERHATHFSRSLSVLPWKMEVGFDIDTSIQLIQNMWPQPLRQQYSSLLTVRRKQQ